MSGPPHARTGLLVNPTSRHGLAKRSGMHVARCLRAPGSDVVDLTAGSAEEVARMSSVTVTSERLDVLFAVGGDKTVGIAIDALTDSKIPPGIPAVGTGNDAARHFRLPRRGVDVALMLAPDALESKRTFATDILEVASEAGSRRMMSVVSAGLDADVNRRTNSFSFPRGGARYARETVSAVANFTPYGFRSEIDGRTCSTPATLASVTSTHFFGTNLPIAPSATVTDGLADVVFVAGLSRLQIIDLPHRLVLGRHPNHPLVHFVRARRVRIACEPRAGVRPLDPMADGDRLGMLPVDVTCLPGAVEVLI